MERRPDVGVGSDGSPHFFRGRSMETESKKIVELVKIRGPGGSLSYTELEEIVGEDRKSNRFRGVLARARRDVLRELGLCLRVKMNEGYTILTAPEQIVEGTRYAKGAVRRLHKSAAIVQVADRSKLTEAERKSADFLATRLVDLCQGLRREVPVLAKVARTKSLPWSHADGNGEPTT